MTKSVKSVTRKSGYIVITYTDGTEQTLYATNSTIPGQGGSGELSEDVKQALLQFARKVAYIDENGQDYYDDLYDALYSSAPTPSAELVSISAVYTQSGTVYNTDTLDSLKSDLVVTAHYSDSTTQTVNEYTLSGTLAEGTSTITVAYGDKTTTFNVTVTVAPSLTSISAVYTQSGTVYNTTTLDSLKGDLVITAHYGDTTATVPSADYTLSGTLEVGTSTVLVSYRGKTTTFDVTVTALQITYTQGSIGSGNSAENRVSGVITSGIHFDDDETLVITITSGYSIYPFGINCHSTESRAGTKASENVLWTYCVSDGDDVFASINDMTGTFTANGKNIKNGPSVGWQTPSVTYVYTPSAQDGFVIKGLGFLVKKNDDSNITPAEAEQIISISKVGV